MPLVKRWPLPTRTVPPAMDRTDRTRTGAAAITIVTSAATTRMSLRRISRQPVPGTARTTTTSTSTELGLVYHPSITLRHRTTEDLTVRTTTISRRMEATMEQDILPGHRLHRTTQIRIPIIMVTRAVRTTTRTIRPTRTIPLMLGRTTIRTTTTIQTRTIITVRTAAATARTVTAKLMLIMNFHSTPQERGFVEITHVKLY